MNFTKLEVSCHDSRDDCFIILYDKVYDLTDFVDEHPGGYELVVDDAGRDATETFESAGHAITKHHIQFLEKYFKGNLIK
jgi:cytochrome b5